MSRSTILHWFPWIARFAIFAAAIGLLLFSWNNAGYRSSGLISFAGMQPLTLSSDGRLLIAGTKEVPAEGLHSTAIIGPIHFINLPEGSETESPMPLEPSKGRFGTTISDAKLSPDGRLLLVIRTSVGMFMHEQYVITLLDRETRAIVMEQTIPFHRRSDEKPSVEFSPNGSLLAWVMTQEEKRAVVVFDLQEQKERYRLPLSLLPVFSPDGKLLATRQEFIGRGYGFLERLQLWNSETGKAIQDVELCGRDAGWDATPRFSTDGKYVAVGVSVDGPQWIQVIEVASGKTSLQTKGWSPQFLSGNALSGIRESTRPMQARPEMKVQEVVVWNPDRWNEKGTFPYDLGGSGFGPILLEPWVTENGQAIALLYDTDSDDWKGSTKSTSKNYFGWWKAFDLNFPRGLGLDIIDHTTGETQTYHLDGSSKFYSSGSTHRLFPLPRTGKILLPKEGEMAEVWDVPPHRTYASVKWMAWVLAAIGLMWYLVAATWRGVEKLQRARVESV